MYTGYTCAFGINQIGVSYFIWTHFIVLIFELYTRSLLVVCLKLIVMLGVETESCFIIIII